MPPDAPLTGALKESSTWRVVYDDGIAVVFRSAARTARRNNFRRRTSAAEKAVIARSRKLKASDRAITANQIKNLGANDNDVFAQFLE